MVKPQQTLNKLYSNIFFSLQLSTVVNERAHVPRQIMEVLRYSRTEFDKTRLLSGTPVKRPQARLAKQPPMLTSYCQ